MARFEDQTTIGKQDMGYRSDEVRGPYREEWAETPKGPAEDRTDSPGGGSGLGENQNPAWAGSQASLESDTAGRGMYGSGEEGASGYGKHESADGEMPSSPTKSSAAPSSAPSDAKSASNEHRHFGPEGGGNYGTYDIGGKGAEGFHRVANSTYDDVIQASGQTKPANGATADEGFGTRHWGHGEFKGDDGAGKETNEGSVLERAAQTVGKFFGIGPKNYRRSNDRVHEDVCEALLNHHEINAAEIEVKVTDGKVCLSGTVEDRQQRRLVEELLTNIPGVGEVENHLRTETYVARTEEADRLVTGEAEVPPTLHS